MKEYQVIGNAASGSIRFNTDSSKLEIYNGEAWFEIDATSPELQTGGTRGLLGGGYSPTPNNANRDYIDQVNVNTTGNAIDFGDPLYSREWPSCTSSSTRGVAAGGDSGDYATDREIQFFDISSGGEAVDFGDLTDRPSSSVPQGISDGHGGL